MSSTMEKAISSPATTGYAAPVRARHWWTRGYDEIKTYYRAYMIFGFLSYVGMVLGWDTGLIGGILTTAAFKRSFGLEADRTPHYIARKRGDIVSVLNAGAMLGGFGGFYFPSRFGHRAVITVGGILLQIGTVIQTACHPGDHGVDYAPISPRSASIALAQLMAGRFITGMGIGLSETALVPYANEVAPAAIRGRLHVIGSLNAVAGIALSFWVNYGVSQAGYDPHDTRIWRIPFGLQALPTAVFMVAVYFAPHSPRWLIEKRGDEAGARRALARISGCSVNDPRVDETVAEIHASIRAMEDDFAEEVPGVKDSTTSSTATLTPAPTTAASARRKLKWRLVFRDRKTVFRLFLGGIMTMMQQWTGTMALNYFSPQIFSSLGLGDVELLATGFYGLVKVTGTTFTLLVGIEHLGRKWSNVIGSIGQITAMYWIGIYLRIHPSVEGKQSGGPINAAAALTIAMVYLYAFFFALGWASVISTISSELAPCNAKLRSVSWAIATISQWFFTTIVSKIVPLMLQDMKYGTFLFFGSLTAVGCLFVVFCLPETQGVPLEKIDALFEGSARDIVKRSLMTLSPSGRRRIHDELATGAL